MKHRTALAMWLILSAQFVPALAHEAKTQATYYDVACTALEGFYEPRHLHYDRACMAYRVTEDGQAVELEKDKTTARAFIDVVRSKSGETIAIEKPITRSYDLGDTNSLEEILADVTASKDTDVLNSLLIEALHVMARDDGVMSGRIIVPPDGNPVGTVVTVQRTLLNFMAQQNNG